MYHYFPRKPPPSISDIITNPYNYIFPNGRARLYDIPKSITSGISTCFSIVPATYSPVRPPPTSIPCIINFSVSQATDIPISLSAAHLRQSGYRPVSFTTNLTDAAFRYSENIMRFQKRYERPRRGWGDVPETGLAEKIGGQGGQVTASNECIFEYSHLTNETIGTVRLAKNT